MGVQNLVPDQLDNCLSYSVVSYLKKLKNQVGCFHLLYSKTNAQKGKEETLVVIRYMPLITLVKFSFNGEHCNSLIIDIFAGES